MEACARVRAGRERGLSHTMGWAIPWAGHREAQGGGATRAGGGDGREWVAAACWAAQVERADQGKIDKGDTVQVPRVPWRNPCAREANKGWSAEGVREGGADATRCRGRVTHPMRSVSLLSTT